MLNLKSLNEMLLNIINKMWTENTFQFLRENYIHYIVKLWNWGIFLIKIYYKEHGGMGAASYPVKKDFFSYSSPQILPTHNGFGFSVQKDTSTRTSRLHMYKFGKTKGGGAQSLRPSRKYWQCVHSYMPYIYIYSFRAPYCLQNYTSETLFKIKNKPYALCISLSIYSIFQEDGERWKSGFCISSLAEIALSINTMPWFTKV